MTISYIKKELRDLKRHNPDWEKKHDTDNFEFNLDDQDTSFLFDFNAGPLV